MEFGERQVAPDVSGIRRDHVARYEWAASMLPAGSVVADLACGVGYGSKILAGAGIKVIAADRDSEAIAYARSHYSHDNVDYQTFDITSGNPWDAKFSAIVSFETLEHVEDPLALLRTFRSMAPRLICSVPNEEVFPFRNYKFHFRHFTRAQFLEILEAAGWRVTGWFGQGDAFSEVEPNVNGRTVIVMAEAAEIDKASVQPGPSHVAILGLGPSIDQYLKIARNLGGRSAYCDEVWAINALGDVLQCDRIFHMDDVRVQQIRADAAPQGNIAKMLVWMRGHRGPIYTSFPHPNYPGLVAFPLEDVINNLGFAYLNNTCAFAVAYAIHIGVKKISMFGCDFTYPDAHSAEKGRACVEYWLGFAMARGIEVATGAQSTLLDAIVPWEEKIYGYDMVKIAIKARDAGGYAVSFTDREKPPTAEEIEARYDHSRHPNRIVESQ